MFNVKMLYMKRVITIAIVQLLILSGQGQNQKIQFIDSISHGINMDNIILRFSELPDTVDARGIKFSERNSYYFDWRQSELRLIDVYRFDEIVKATW
jgi:hypothetical protein